MTDEPIEINNELHQEIWSITDGRRIHAVDLSYAAAWQFVLDNSQLHGLTVVTNAVAMRQLGQIPNEVLQYE